MKSKTVAPAAAKRGSNLFELAFLALPILALTPNFFIVPDLSHQALVTNELVFWIAALIFTGIGLFETLRAQPGSLRVGRLRWLLLLALAVFIIWQVISLIWAPTQAEGARVAGLWLGFGVFFMAGVFRLGARAAERLQWALMLASTLLAASLFYERAVYGSNLLGIFFNHGISAELMVTVLPLQILTFICARQRWLSLVALLVSALTALAVLAGLRRGALLALFFSLFVIGVASLAGQIEQANKTRVGVIAVTLAVLLISGGIYYRQAIVTRVASATQLNSGEDGLASRARGWAIGWEMGKRHALFGVGNAGYASLYGDYRKYLVSNPSLARIAAVAGPEDSDEIRSPLTHNEYLQIFIELGIIGVLLAAAFWFLVVRSLWRGRRNHWVLGALLGLASFGISSFFSSFSFRCAPTTLILACVLSIGFAFLRNESSTEARALPKPTAIIAILLLMIACLALTVRAYHVYASQLLQGRATMSTQPLDFNFYPNTPTGNEVLARRYQQVLELDPENAGGHLGYALLLYQMKRPAEALPQAEYAWRHGYSRPFAYALVAFIHEANNEPDKATQVMNDCVSSYPQSLFARAVYTEMLRKQGKADEMHAQQQAMNKMDPLDAQSWEIALRLKGDAAIAEAQRRGVKPPTELWPKLISAITFARAYHYLQ